MVGWQTKRHLHLINSTASAQIIHKFNPKKKTDKKKTQKKLWTKKKRITKSTDRKVRKGGYPHISAFSCTPFISCRSQSPWNVGKEKGATCVREIFAHFYLNINLCYFLLLSIFRSLFFWAAGAATAKMKFITLSGFWWVAVAFHSIIVQGINGYKCNHRKDTYRYIEIIILKSCLFLWSSITSFRFPS